MLTWVLRKFILTCFSATVIDHLQQTLVDCPTVYIYFDHHEGTTQTTTNVLSCILKQLLVLRGERDWPEQVLQELLVASCDPRNFLDIQQITELIVLCL